MTWLSEDLQNTVMQTVYSGLILCVVEGEPTAKSLPSDTWLRPRQTFHEMILSRVEHTR